MAGTPAPDFLQSLWLFLHQPGFVPLTQNVKLFVAYPILPWVGVMASGYALGAVYTWETERRRKFLFKFGLALSALFIIIRAINIYGDPQPWTTQSSPLFTVLIFSQHDEISGIAVVSADDFRTCAVDFSLD